MKNNIFYIKNFIIDALIAFIPLCIIIGILRELGFGGALIIGTVILGFISLVGIARRKLIEIIKHRKNGQ